MKALLIPIKDPARGKTRLSELLSAQERARLVWAMFEDVCRAVSACKRADRIVIVTSFAPAIERAQASGWDVLIEESQISESASVDRASRRLAESGFDSVMRLPADVPCVQASDIDELLAIDLARPGAALAPSREGTGTNAIIRTPPDLFPSRFGPDSLRLHKQEAARVGVECLIVENARIALDIDEPSDIELLLERGRGTETFDELARMNMEERLRRLRIAD
jgi:2-phospho-L-lactate/phosphoenolpyruvate guanylyltransferase